MKKLILGLFLLTVLGMAGGAVFVFGDYSDGYRMGMLSTFEMDGYVPFFKSGEGQLLLGRDSSPLAVEYKTSDGATVPKEFNPWHFSVSQGKASPFLPLTGSQVWIHYREHRFNLSLLRNTRHEAVEAARVSGGKPTPASMEGNKPVLLGRSEGVRTGRIVKASLKGNVIGTWEIVLQVGDAGNHFKPLSIDDRALYEFAVACLKTGSPVRVQYVDKGILKFDFNDTPYEVWKIEAL